MSDVDRQLRETGARLRAEQAPPRVDLAAATASPATGSKGRSAILVGVVLVLAAGLVALIANRADNHGHSRVSVAPTTEPTAQQEPGVMTGFLEQCVGRRRPGSPPLPYATGTVFALRGAIRVQPIPGGDQEILPTERVGRQHVDRNTPYRFVLPAGSYVIAFSYPWGPDLEPMAGIDVTVLPGETVHMNLPNVCK